MSVALLLITHAPFGSATLEAVLGTLGSLPLPTEVMDIRPDCDPEQEQQRAHQLLEQLDQGDGVLLLTDLFGATPSNIACSVMDGEHALTLISGLNLAMLIRIMNYAGDDLQSLAERALNGGISGIHMHQAVAVQEPITHD